MNLLTMAPLCDSRGKVRYFIGAQVDVSGLVKDGSSLEAFEQAIAMEMEKQRPGEPQQMEDASNRSSVQPKDEFQDLAEMLNMGELNVIRYYGGNMHSEQIEDDGCSIRSPSNRPRLLLKEPENDRPSIEIISTPDRCGRLPGVYEHVCMTINMVRTLLM